MKEGYTTIEIYNRKFMGKRRLHVIRICNECFQRLKIISRVVLINLTIQPGQYTSRQAKYKLYTFY